MSNTLTRTDEMIAQITERQRLEQAVIEASKAWRLALVGDSDKQNWWPLMDALNALLEFESQQMKEK